MVSWIKCSEFLLKVIVAVFNTIIAILGLTCIIFGAKVATSDDIADVSEQVKSGDLLSGTYLIIAVGAIILIIALMGCCGAILGNKCLLLSYFIIVALILIAEVVGAGLIWKNVPKFEKSLEDVLMKDVDRYASDESSRVFLDTIQTNLKCCGMKGADDYATKNFKLPDSCFDQKTHKVFETGCYVKVKDYLSKAANTIGGLAMGLTCIQIFSLVSVLCLYCLLRKTISSSVA